jgi:hypothetical protein
LNRSVNTYQMRFLRLFDTGSFFTLWVAGMARIRLFIDNHLCELL